MPYKFAYNQRFAARAHYEANKDDYMARAKVHNKRQRKATREFIHRAKDKSCADCGNRFAFYIMQFDHVRGIKLFNIGDYGQFGAGAISRRKLIAEIAKCDVVCANCHAERTYQRWLTSAEVTEESAETTDVTEPTLF
jgi:hypothetical protein